MTIDIHPTGKCFDDVLNFISQSFLSECEDTFIACHGLCVREDGIYAHAWVLCVDTNEVIHIGLLNGETVTVPIPKAEFYKMFGVIEVTYYSMRQISYYNWRYNNYGPWEMRYLEKCKSYDGQTVTKCYDMGLSEFRFLLKEMGLMNG